MEPLGISRNQLARDLDVPVGRISDITNGKRGITADTALRFGRFFGTGPELWLRLQAEYDIEVARVASWTEIEARVRILDISDSFEEEDETLVPDEVDQEDRELAEGRAESASDADVPDKAGSTTVSTGTSAVSSEFEAPSAPSEDNSAQDADEEIGIPPRPSSPNAAGSS